MSYLVHFGVKGMKWGIRRYETDDGELTFMGEQKAKSIKRFKSGLSGMMMSFIAPKMHMSLSQLYVATQPMKNAIKGFLIGGPATALFAANVTAIRNKRGSEFIRKTFGE